MQCVAELVTRWIGSQKAVSVFDRATFPVSIQLSLNSLWFAIEAISISDLWRTCVIEETFARTPIQCIILLMSFTRVGLLCLPDDWLPRFYGSWFFCFLFLKYKPIDTVPKFTRSFSISYHRRRSHGGICVVTRVCHVTHQRNSCVALYCIPSNAAALRDARNRLLK